MSDLTVSAMLATLSIRRWQGSLTDKKVTSEVASNHNVKVRRAGHYRKHAIDTDAPSFKAVVTAASNLRHKHYWHTLPWGQDGARILTAANYDTYSKDIRDLKTAFLAAADKFCDDYPALKEGARVELNGLFDEADYPTDMKSRFGVELSIMPLPDAGDFRVKLTDDAVAHIRADIAKELKATAATAMQEPYERLYEHITRMVDRLSDPKGQFRDTLVTGLSELCQVLPALNLTGDKRLSTLTQRAEQLIAGIDAEDLRADIKLRANVAAKAAEIQDAMSAFMGVKS